MKIAVYWFNFGQYSFQVSNYQYSRIDLDNGLARTVHLQFVLFKFQYWVKVFIYAICNSVWTFYILYIYMVTDIFYPHIVRIGKRDQIRWVYPEIFAGTI